MSFCVSCVAALFGYANVRKGPFAKRLLLTHVVF